MGIKGIKGYHTGERGTPDIPRTRKRIPGWIKHRGFYVRGSKKSGACFVATAVYGGCNHPSVLALRKFRDDRLAPTMLGTIFIRAYYAFAPRFANVVAQNETMKNLVRRLLDRFVQTLGSS